MIKAYNARIVTGVNFEFEQLGKIIKGKTYCIIVELEEGKQKLCLINSLNLDYKDGENIVVGLVNGKYEVISF